MPKRGNVVYLFPVAKETGCLPKKLNPVEKVGLLAALFVFRIGFRNPHMRIRIINFVTSFNILGGMRGLIKQLTSGK